MNKRLLFIICLSFVFIISIQYLSASFPTFESANLGGADNGNNYSIQGVVFGPYGAAIDACLLDNITLNKYYLDSNYNLSVTNHVCLNGCYNGACINQSLGYHANLLISYLSNGLAFKYNYSNCVGNSWGNYPCSPGTSIYITCLNNAAVNSSLNGSTVCELNTAEVSVADIPNCYYAPYTCPFSTYITNNIQQVSNIQQIFSTNYIQVVYSPNNTRDSYFIYPPNYPYASNTNVTTSTNSSLGNGSCPPNLMLCAYPNNGSFYCYSGSTCPLTNAAGQYPIRLVLGSVYDTVLINGIYHTINLTSITTNQATMIVDGTSVTMSVGTTQQISGLNITLTGVAPTDTEILVQSNLNATIANNTNTTNTTCVPNWQCGDWTPLNCSAGDTQTRVCSDSNGCIAPQTDTRACGSNLTSPYPNGSNNLACTSGCLYQNACVPYGYRTALNYCNIDNTLTSQITSGACNNNFECTSNVCANSQCVSPGFLQQILNFFKRLFGIQ